MIINYVKGNLFSTELKAIVQGCNAQRVMGSGVAKLVRQLYPEAYEDYINQPKLYMGKIYPVQCDGMLIINAITQEFYGRDNKVYVSYTAIESAMRELNLLPITDVAMPKIGAGLGGGDWNIISEIIETELTKVQPWVYEL